MKKIFTVLLAMAMILSFAACKDQGTPQDDSIIDVNLKILIEQDDSMINTTACWPLMTLRRLRMLTAIR